MSNDRIFIYMQTVHLTYWCVLFAQHDSNSQQRVFGWHVQPWDLKVTYSYIMFSCRSSRNNISKDAPTDIRKIPHKNRKATTTLIAKTFSSTARTNIEKTSERSIKNPLQPYEQSHLSYYKAIPIATCQAAALPSPYRSAPLPDTQ